MSIDNEITEFEYRLGKDSYEFTKQFLSEKKNVRLIAQCWNNHKSESGRRKRYLMAMTEAMMIWKNTYFKDTPDSKVLEACNTFVSICEKFRPRALAQLIKVIDLASDVV